MLPTNTPSRADLPAAVPRDTMTCLRAMQSEGMGVTLIDRQGVPLMAAGMLAEASALGAYGSGLLLAGDGLAREAGGRRCDHVLVSATENNIISMPVGDPAGHLLIVVAPRQLALGPVLWSARRCCADLRAAGLAG